MKKKLSSLLQYLFFLGLGIVLIWYSSKDLTDAQVRELKDSFAQTRFLYILPVIASLILAHYFRALRWRLLMDPLGYAPGRANTFLVVLIGYLFNLLVPRLGEVMKCTMLAKYEKVPADKLIGTIVAERAVDVVCLLLVTFFMMVTQFDLLGESMIASIKTMTAGKSVAGLAVTIGGFIAIIFAIRWVFNRFTKVRFLRAIRKIWIGIWRGLTSIGRIRYRGWFLFHTAAIWFLYLLSIWLGFKAFPDVQSLGLKASVAILVFGSLGMIATQGGIGAYQFAVQKTLLLFGISAVTGLAFGWVLWGAQTAIVLLAGMIALIILPLINHKKSP
ncbi:MAG: flippase-like domain-containing protein [Chitinophagaceae bacterium]|jgi:hypothetical protein|nr:flippase-like domain-containing protein [Chitinophagaceae bacterium]